MRSSLAKALAERRMVERTTGEPAKPTIPGKWVSECNQSTKVNGSKVAFGGGGLAILANDATMQRQYSRSGSILPFAPIEFVGTPLEWLNVTSWVTVNGTFIELSGAKYVQDLDQKYNDIFSWVPASKYDGDEVVNGTAVHRWALSLERPTPISLLLKATEDGTPVSFEENVTITTPFSPGPSFYQIDYEFLSFVAGGEAPGAWAGFDEDLFTNPPPCPAETIPPSTSMTSYIFHPRENFNISAQDNGDAQGDVFFVCEDLITNSSKQQGEDYQWITQWTIEYIPRFGQYQNCNGYPSHCLGFENFWVGHEAALGMGAPAGGQCEPNPKVGEWYSMPVGGKCAAGVKPDGVTCTWTAARIKTIDSHCLFDHGYLPSCKADGRAPFAQAAKKFMAAFASEDEAAGGCPELAHG